jgi:hypothetical protein
MAPLSTGPILRKDWATMKGRPGGLAAPIASLSADASLGGAMPAFGESCGQLDMF